MSIPYQIVRSHRRSIAIMITPQGTVIVKAPQLVPRFMIDRFVKEKSDWIEHKLNLIKLHPVSSQKKYIDGERFLYLGKTYSLQRVSGSRQTVSISDKLYVPNLPVSVLKTALLVWYRAQAKAIILERCLLYEKKSGLKPKSITITNARSKWGTCFHDNAMNFSWRLVMAPVSVIDYVVAHEFAHITVKNHSKAFWDRVYALYPLYKMERRWLKKNGGMLDI